MFSFYGSKSKIAHKYPKPIYDTIIEPFAGSSRYSLLHWEKNVVLWEIDEKIYTVWKFLQEASRNDILSLPDVPNATKLETIDGFSQLSDAEKWLIGFCCNGGSAQPKNVSGRHNFNSWNRDKKRIADKLHRIKHWSINLGDYKNAPNSSKATWYIDPPYRKRGKWYKHNQIDYAFLGEWCRTRFGQVIVCENYGETWLPFEPLAEVPFTHFKNDADKKKKTVEGIWYKEE